MNRAMQFVALLGALAAASRPAVAQPDCWVGPFGPYGASVPAYALAMQVPVVGEVALIDAGTPAARGLVVAKQEIAIAPVQRFLAADVVLGDERGAEVAKGLSLSAGSQVTVWRGADGERQCLVAWRGGLFGGAMGEGHYRWLCLEDRNGDGAYDNAWRPYSKNLGLSFSRLDMPLQTPVRWTSAAPVTPSTAAAPQQTAALGGNKVSRQIEVRSVSSNAVRLRYWGAGVPRAPQNQAELALDRPGSVTLGGVTVTLTPTDKRTATLSASGAFDPPMIEEQCEGTAYAIGSFAARVMFSFPNW